MPTIEEYRGFKEAQSRTWPIEVNQWGGTPVGSGPIVENGSVRNNAEYFKPLRGGLEDLEK